MSNIEFFEFNDFILGPDKPITASGTFENGHEVPVLTPIMVDPSTGYFLPWDGDGVAVGLTALAVDSSTGISPFSYYKTGSFRASSVNWSLVDPISEPEMQAAFAGTAISVG